MFSALQSLRNSGHFMSLMAISCEGLVKSSQYTEKTAKRVRIKYRLEKTKPKLPILRVITSSLKDLKPNALVFLRIRLHLEQRIVIDFDSGIENGRIVILQKRR